MICSLTPDPEITLLNSLKGIFPNRDPNRFVYLVQSGICGIKVEDYQTGEFEIKDAEDAWIDCVLSGKSMPSLDLTVPNGYDLCHTILYATDFGRSPLASPEAVTRVQTAALTTSDPDLLSEYASCILCVGGSSADLSASMLNALVMDSIHQHHAYLKAFYDILSQKLKA